MKISLRHVLVCLPFALAACAHANDAARRLEIAKIDPNSEPAPPKPAPADHLEQLDTEFYLGTADDEQQQFLGFAEQIQGLQAKISTERHQPMQRGFHAKSHGCLRGALKLRADRDPRTRFGVFANDGALPLWVRYSNGVGWKQADDERDARGMALKLVGIPGQKYLDDEKETQDFLMTNSPTPVGRDAVEFMKFAKANARGRAAGIGFLLGHPRTAGPALIRTSPIDSMVTAQYWSGGAYHLGAHQAVKFTAKPCEGTKPRKTSRKNPDYLAADLADAAKAGMCMTFYVQFQADSADTPIENASHEWTEKKAPLVPVGDIVMPPQAFADQQFCDALAFSPWHSIAAHKPMGHINRARRWVYAASQKKRPVGTEPTVASTQMPGAPASP
jgi:catalase